MQAIAALAVAVGILCLVLIAVVSMRGPRFRRRRTRDGAFIPLSHPRTDDGGDDGDGDFGDGG